MSAVVFALCASLCWGSGDLLAGLSSRRGSVWSVSLVSQGVGLVVGVVVLIALGRSWVGWEALAPSLGAGVLLSVAMAAYFEALAVGTMSVVAPISSVSVAVPVIVGLARGEAPSTVQMVGVMAAVVGVVLASYDRGEAGTVAGTIEVGVAGAMGGAATAEDVAHRGGSAEAEHPRPRNRLAALLAVCSAVAFGLVMVGFSETAKYDPFWPAIGGRMTSVLVLTLIVAARAAHLRDRGTPGGSRPIAAGSAATELDVTAGDPSGGFLGLPVAVIPATVAAGLLHLAAATFFSVATTRGLLSLVSVLASLMAVVTVALAHLFLHERLDRLQWAGAILAICGVLAIAGG